MEEPGGFSIVHGVAKSRTWLSDFTHSLSFVCFSDICFYWCCNCVTLPRFLQSRDSGFFISKNGGNRICHAHKVEKIEWDRYKKLWSLDTRRWASVSSVQWLSLVQLFATPWTAARQASLSITNSGVHSNSCPSSQWCHPAISSSVVPFFSCPQSLQASESFPMSQLFAWGGQSTGVSALASVLLNNTQDWSPLEWTGQISL